VYVVQLDDVLDQFGLDERGAVYVGHTGKDPEDRFADHLDDHWA
jgi:hypothetical protein